MGRVNLCVAMRTDGLAGGGIQADPFNAAAGHSMITGVTLIGLPLGITRGPRHCADLRAAGEPGAKRWESKVPSGTFQAKG